MALTCVSSVQIVRLAGLGANSTITSSSNWLISIGENAEGEFCADTGRDWISGWNSVNAAIQKKVSKAIAAKAAKEIVNYDGTNYFSRLEQETILDILTDDYNQAVAVLSKLDPNYLKGVDD